MDIHQALNMPDSSKDTGQESQDNSMQIEAEEVFLAGFIDKAMQKKFNAYHYITDKHFTDPFLRNVHSTCCEFIKNNLNLDFLSLSSAFCDEAEKLHVLGLINRIESETITQSYAFYLDTKYKAKLLEQELLNAYELVKTEQSTSTPRISNILKGLTQSISEKTYSPFTKDDCFDDFGDELDKYVENYANKKSAISTGISDLDKMLNGGFHNSNLIILGGRPSMGKSALSILFMNNAIEQGKTVLNISLEMTSDETVSRLIALFDYKFGDRKITYSDLMSKQIPLKKVNEIKNKMKSGNFPIVNNYKTLTVDNICAYAERIAHDLLRKGKRLDMIFIDYLQIIPKPIANKTTNDLLAEITGKIRSLAKRLDVPIILLSQLNRDVEKEKDIESKRPNASHLRESGAIEQDAHVIIFPFRPSFHEKNLDDTQKKWKEDYIELCINKNRQGTTGIVKAYCDMGKNFIGDRAIGDDGKIDPIDAVASLGKFNRKN